VGVVQRRRHELGRLVAGIAEHDALVARALVLVAGRVHAHGDVGRLGVQVHVDLGALPVEALLLVADVADGGAGELDHPIRGDGVGAADLAGDHDAVRGGERLAGDAGLRHRGEIGVDHRVGNPVADLVGVALGDRLAGEEIILP